MNSTLIIGAPGTGKTRTLVQKVLDIKPDKFCFVSFTRRAAREAKNRLRDFYKESELKYVRTIHSLCFELLGLHTGQVMTWDQVRLFGNLYGYEFRGRSFSFEDDSYHYLSDDDIEYRNMMFNVAQMQPFPDSEMRERYLKYKLKEGLYDFNDMIIRCTDPDIRMPIFELLCVDEIQDLTPIQLEFIFRLAHNAKIVFYAGDDNQMIFEWAGVDRPKFFELVDACKPEVLYKNYRVDGDIARLARKTIYKCNFPGYSKVIDESAIVNVGHGFPDINPKESYLMLARNSYFLPRIAEELTFDGHKYSFLTNEFINTKIKLSTIHSAKGAEADNVIIYTDVSPATYEHIDEDKEHRVWYVGITRAKKMLYIIEPQTSYFYELY